MLQREIDAGQAADIAKFEEQLQGYLAGDIPEDVFRVFRLNNGIYGQRQGGHNQMVRVKAPYGSVTPEQLDMFGYIADEYSRGWGHLTTRQNVQFHFVQLERVPQLLRDLASVGLTSREACGDTVRNVMGCHLAGACPFEVLDISPWAEATFQHFLRNPLAQRLPRKFKINFSGCSTDCGQAMFNDVGVVAASRTLDDGTVEVGFRVYVAGGLGANPHPALALEPFTSREDLLPTIESILRVFEQNGNRKNKLRARMKWLVDTLGFEELQERIFAIRKFLLASSTWPGGIPDEVEKHGDAPAGVAVGVTPTAIGQGTPVALRGTRPYERWEQANVVRGAAKGTVSANVYSRLGDVTSDQFRSLAVIQRDLALEVRITNRQNFVFRGLTEAQLPTLYARLESLGMAEPGAELARDVVACPGADTCNLAVTQSRGLADAIGVGARGRGAGRGWRRAHEHLGLHELLRPASRIGHRLLRRRAPGRTANPRRATRCCSAAMSARSRSTSARRRSVCRQRTHRRPQSRSWVASPPNAKPAKRSDRGWIESGGAKAIAADLKDLDNFPTPEEAPEYYVDFDETGPYVAEVGESECAT